MEKAAARRRQVPAFGEWNYYCHYDGPETVAPPALAYCYGATPEPEACSDVWFRYSPPPRKPTPAKKPRRRVPEGDSDASLEKKGRRSGRPAPASEAAGCGLARTTRLVRPVDEDLYQVPPPELASHRRRPRRSMWMGCLGCVA
ncbi:uncharacterized protein LOC124657317 [Lolium rigidum]|uniref:uncharacterized protein LOC124657317 n=1 Tax=Lolium rigidum TaxID=89674 RepID=UPI001F5E1923|nr:uncharacterized protein LOC124657317 [Lolium rigidum]